MTCAGFAGAGLLLVSVVASAGAQIVDERAAAREIVSARGEAVITVMATLKARMSRAGSDQAMPDQTVRTSATVLDATGLAVVALSALDPGGLAAANPNFAQAKLSMSTELSDVRMRLADGTEAPARVVLRDSDLDLLFVRPAAALAKPIAAVSAAASRLSQLDPVVLVQRLGGTAGWKLAAAPGTVEVVVDKPRTVYLVSATTNGHAIGATVFDIKGHFAGVLTLRAIGEPKTYGLTGVQGDPLQWLGMVRVVVPAADILEVAKQAGGQ